MAIAKQRVGAGTVTRGYKPKAERMPRALPAERREPPALLRAMHSLRFGLREMLAALQDELVYVTVDTLRVMRYVRCQYRGGRRRAFALDRVERQYAGNETELAVQPMPAQSVKRRA